MDKVTPQDDLDIRLIETDLLDRLSADHVPSLFPDDQYFFKPSAHYSQEERDKLEGLKADITKPRRLNFAAFKGDELVGWSWGIQESAETFYIVNSAVISSHQGKGIYSCLIRAVIEEVAALGFQMIYSRHAATNNAVIIPELKAGFVISSLELSDQYGVLVHLRWYKNPLRRKMMDFRAGTIGPDKDIRNLLGG